MVKKVWLLICTILCVIIFAVIFAKVKLPVNIHLLWFWGLYTGAVALIIFFNTYSVRGLINRFAGWIFEAYFKADRLYKYRPPQIQSRKEIVLIAYLFYFEVKYAEGDTETRVELFEHDSSIRKAFVFSSAYQSLVEDYSGHQIKIIDVKILK